MNKLPSTASAHKNTANPPTRIIIFGAGEAGRRTISYYRTENNTQILFATDNARQKHGTEIDEVPILPPKEIINHFYDKIVVASMHHQEIVAQLIDDFNICPDKIEIACTSIKKGVNLQDKNRQALARELLWSVCNELTRNEIPHHIDHGTLLGIYRNGDLLPWDNDVDLALHSFDLDAAFEALAALAKRFRSVHCEANAWVCYPKHGNLGTPEGEQEVLRILKFENAAACHASTRLQLDLIIKYPYKEKLYWRAGATTLFADSSYFNNRTTIRYNGARYSIPADTSGYLATMYGDWRVPMHTWHHASYKNATSEESTKPIIE